MLGTRPSLVSNIDEYIALDLIESRKSREQHTFLANISYGEDPEETLDIFQANRERETSPTVIYFHGGAWKLLSKDHASFPASTFLKEGCNFIAVNFSLIPHISLNQLVLQCKKSLQWIYQNIEKFGGDRNQLFVAGHSSGAHIEP